MGIKLGDNINITAGLPNDCRYQNAAVGPYTGVTHANSIVSSDIRYIGLTVNINNTEYWYKDGVADINLVEKTSGGGSGLLNWTGSTVNAIGTYISISGICAQPNLTFDGNLLTVTGIACATTCFVGSGAGLTGTASSLTVGTATNALCLGGVAAASYAKLASPIFTGTLTAPIISATTCFVGSGAGLTDLPASGGDVCKVGTPVICQVAVWTGDGTICGGTSLRMSANQLCVIGSIAASTNIFASGSAFIGNNLALNSNIGCISLDSDADGFSKMLLDSTGSYCGWGACTFILASAGGAFVFTNGEDNSLNSICANTITGNTFYGSGIGLTGTASNLTVGTATNALCLGGIAAASYATDSEVSTNYVSKITEGTNSFVPNYLIYSDGGTTNRDFIAFNDTTNAFYFNADTTLTQASANAAVYAACFYGSGEGLTGTASSLTVGTATNATNATTATNALCLGGSLASAYAKLASPTFTGTLTAPIICATTCFAGSGAGLTGTASSLTVGTATNATTATNALCLGGVAAASYLRSNADDTLTAAIVVPTANRDEGIFGTYDSTKTQHIWSMGTSYRNAADGSSFGNLYGLAYQYNGSAGSHGTYQVINGIACVGMGSNLWAANCVIADICVTTPVTCATSCHRGAIIYGTTCTTSPIHCATTAFRTTGTGLRYCGGTGCGCAVDWIASSDCRIKKCIEPISNALSVVNQLCGVCYELCENNSKDIGLIAQEVEKIEPRLVSRTEPIHEYVEKYNITDEMLGLKYDKFAGLFVEAIKELKLEIESLKTEINTLKNENSL